MSTAINNSVENFVPKFEASKHSDFNACDYAEYSFASTIEYLGEPQTEEYDPRYGAPEISQVFMHNGLPLFLKKDFGDKSAITLSDVQIDCHVYKPGLIVWLSTRGVYREGNSMSVLTTDVITSVRIGRYAFLADSIETRKKKIIDDPEIFAHEFKTANVCTGDIARYATMSDIRKYVKEIVDQKGLHPQNNNAEVSGIIGDLVHA